MKKRTFFEPIDLESEVFPESLFEEIETLEMQDFPEMFRDSYHAETNEKEQL